MRAPINDYSETNGNNEWTVMFFLAGDPNLSAQMISQLKAITDAGYQEETTVLVHFDPNSNGTSAKVFNVNHVRKLHHDKAKQGDRRTVIGDGTNSFVRNIQEDCYGQQVLTGATAIETLRTFLKYAREKHRASNYLLFFIGHGMIVGNDAFLPDTEPETTSAISLKQLGGVLKEFSDQAKAESSKFHLIGFHSCSMSAVEVAYELKDTARFMMGAQGLAFVGSWPYRQLLKGIFKYIEDSKTGKNDVPSDATAVAELILRRLQALNFYNAEDFGLAGYSADLSLCSLDGAKVEKLTKPLKDLSLALREGLKYERTTERILMAHWKAQSFWQENYTDLFDFCEGLLEQCREESEPQIALRNACTYVLEVLKTDSEQPFDQLVAFSDYFGPAYQYAHGLSIYFPWARPADSVLQKYRHYAFTRPIVPENSAEPEEADTWLAFLKDYFNLTQRDVREGKKGMVSPRAKGATASAVGSVGGNPSPALGDVEGKPNPALGGAEGKPNPALGEVAVVEGKPNPAMGGGGFGFTVTKNYPAPTDLILSSRPRSQDYEDIDAKLWDDDAPEAT